MAVNLRSILFLMVATIAILQANAFMPMPYVLRSPIWELDDPFRVLEQTPFAVPKGGIETSQMALACVDWKETPTSHVMWMDIPGMKKDDIKIEVEENRVLRISGERKGGDEEEKEVEGEKWHRAERTNGKFWRQFRLPGNADLDHVKAHLENGVLKIVMPKLREEHKRQPKIIDIAQDNSGASGEDIKTTKAAQ